MSTIVVDAALRDRLLAASAEAEIRDEQGRKLGRFIPEINPEQFTVPGLDLSPAELARRRAPDAKTYTTAEVLDHLRSLK
jgi:hypothetical protein